MLRTGPHFTDRARAAAATARIRRAALKAATKNDLQVFAIRSDNYFTWEIRQFGGVKVTAGDKKFLSPAEARAAGKAALVLSYDLSVNVSSSESLAMENSAKP